MLSEVEQMEFLVTIFQKEDIPDEKIREVISKTGYEVGEISRESGEKKGFFSSLKK